MENEYNKRFKNKEMSNDDFDVEGLWDGITEELDTPMDKAPISFWKRYGGAFLLLVLFAGLGYIFFEGTNADTLVQNEQASLDENQKTQEKKVAKNSAVSTNLDEGDATKGNTVISEQNTVNSNKTKATDERNKSSIQTKKTDINWKKTNYTNTSLSNSETVYLDDNNTKTASTKSLNSQKKKNTSSIEDTDKDTPIVGENIADTNTANSLESTPLDKNEGKKEVEENLNNSPVQKPKYSPDTIALLLVKLEDLSFIEDSLLYTGIREVKKRIETKDKVKLLFEGGIYGGLNFTNFKFKFSNDDSLDIQKGLTESSIVGQTYGLNAGMLYKGFRINTGVEYHNLWTKFALQSQINTTALHTQALTLVRIDSTGNTLSREMRDTTVNALTTRSIEHYNRYQVWSIPLEVGIYRARKKWSYGASAGTSFNFLANQSGKTLDANGNVIDFDKNSDKVLIQSFNMSLRANVFLAYHLNNKVRLSLAPKWSWTKQDVFNGILQSEIQQLSLTIGLRSSF